MFRTLLLFLLVTVKAWGQTTPQDSDELRRVVILARHGVRSPIDSETRSSAFNAQPWPEWPVEPGTLTPHGIEALKRMGEFYRQRYAALFTEGCNSVYVESTNTSRTIASANATLSAVVPDCTVDVNADLLQDPATIDRQRLADATNGRMANQPEWFERAFAAPLARDAHHPNRLHASRKIATRKRLTSAPQWCSPMGRHQHESARDTLGGHTRPARSSQ